MVGCVGDDEFGRGLVTNLENSNVIADGIRICENDSTGIAVVAVDSKGNNQIIVVPGSNNRCDVSYIEQMASMIQSADIVVLQMEIPEDAVYFCIQQAKALGKTVVLNPAPAPEHIPDEILQLVDYLTPNETELMHLCGTEGETIDEYTLAAKSLLAKGVGNVVVTVGSRGALIVNRSMEQVVPSVETNVVDTTAAGDCFNAAMVVALLEGEKLLRAVQFANAAASISVSRVGAQTSLPTRKEVLDKYKPS